jgi:glycosyltransferase involved in cell wall biosynthesis
MECLIVDDCGTDGSMAIVRRMLSEYKGPVLFRILKHNHNRGLSAARNTGTITATGEYLYYLDSDDSITPDCIEKLMGAVIKYPGVQMVQGNAKRVFAQGGESVLIPVVIVSYADSLEEVRKCYYDTGQLDVTVWNKLLKRDFVVDNSLFCEEGLSYEDNLWSFYLVKHLKIAAFLADITYLHLKRSSSITTCGDEEARIRSFITIYRDILTHLTPGFERQEYEYYAESIARSYFFFVSIVPQFDEVLQLCRKYGRLYSCWTFRIKLALFSFLGKYKSGKKVWEFLQWFIHPSLIPKDIKRIWRKRMVGFKLPRQS